MIFQTHIQTATVGSGGSGGFDFTSIPGTYTDLCLVISARATSTTPTMTIRTNGANSFYSGRYLKGTSSATSSTDTTLIGDAAISSYTANTFSNHILYFPNYATSNYKTVCSDSAAVSNTAVGTSYMLWADSYDTAAITRIEIWLSNFAEGSTASLYGILKGSGGATVS